MLNFLFNRDINWDKINNFCLEFIFSFTIIGTIALTYFTMIGAIPLYEFLASLTLIVLILAMNVGIWHIINQK